MTQSNVRSPSTHEKQLKYFIDDFVNVLDDLGDLSQQTTSPVETTPAVPQETTAYVPEATTGVEPGQ